MERDFQLTELHLQCRNNPLNKHKERKNNAEKEDAQTAEGDKKTNWTRLRQGFSLTTNLKHSRELGTPRANLKRLLQFVSSVTVVLIVVKRYHFSRAAFDSIQFKYFHMSIYHGLDFDLQYKEWSKSVFCMICFNLLAKIFTLTFLLATTVV